MSTLLTAKKMIELSVDGRAVRVFEGSTILDACRQLGIETPTLCYGDTLTPVNVCRVCVVELEGVVSPGVETGCLILTTDSGAFTLIGRTSGIRAGDRVRVRGAEAPDVATFCQQGTAFRVDALL